MRILAAAIVGSLLANGAMAAKAPPTLVENEYAFARDVAKHGIRDGFLMYLDPQSITFGPLPVKAYDFYRQKKPNATQLHWYPVFALLSASGDFGVDTGPWTANWTQDGKQNDAHGEWLTVWSSNDKGVWHALFDGGVGHDAPAVAAPALPENAKVLRLKTSKQALYPEAAQAAIQKAEANFSDIAEKDGLSAAYAAVATDGVRLLRDDALPLVGRDDVLRGVSADKSALQWSPAGGSVAKSGDLGYVYGMTYSVTDKEHATPRNTYTHVWQLDKGGWKLLIASEQGALPTAPPSATSTAKSTQ
jgi:ketosteroid isomerase-like protein